MLIGDKQNFAIEIEIEFVDIVDGRVYGLFLFWLSGYVIGDKDDTSVYLDGCINWLRDFVTKSRDRYEPCLDQLSKDKVYKKLHKSIYLDVYNNEIENVYDRFDISHLGMSSFNNVIIFLLTNKQGIARCIWQQDDEEIKEAFSKIDEMNNVARKAMRYFEDELAKKQ